MCWWNSIYHVLLTEKILGLIMYLFVPNWHEDEIIQPPGHLCNQLQIHEWNITPLTYSLPGLLRRSLIFKSSHCNSFEIRVGDGITGIILGMDSGNTGRRYNVTSSRIEWAHTQNDSCTGIMLIVKVTCLYLIYLIGEIYEDKPDDKHFMIILIQ